ncbi:insulinase family protein [Longispora sp. NPDC051575]|uniref:M16 family metallopeptidase n=1 Tax=Longispora sp. NPDC051575 TaxID=3154943 RepID=UPI003418DF66
MIHETEVDGVPTLLAPISGPMQAGLFFRVGTADETLARSGVTHLVEHLALHRHGQTDYHFNGTTGGVVTHFHMQGSESDIVAYLTGVCESLTDLPVERLETEKEILRTEAAGRNRAVNESMGLWRYGARDHGLRSYQELGLPALGADDVRAWADAWFTRDNAVLWITGNAVPAGLKLRLREGVRRPVPVASSALPATPAYFAGPDNVVVFDTVVERSAAASVYAGVLDRELFRSLRQEGGYSYTAGAAYDPRGDGHAVVTAVADALPEKRGAMLGGFLDVLWKLRVGRIEAEDLAATRTKAEEYFQLPELDAARLPTYAMNLVTGQPNHTVDELLAELRAVTPADVHAVAERAMDAGLLMVPHGHGADGAGFVAAPTHSTGKVSGRSHRSLVETSETLVVGGAGVSLVREQPSTVRYDECAALLVYPDGARHLFGHDGISVRIEPTLFTLAPGALAPIDAAVPASAVVPMPARPAGNIPIPPDRPRETVRTVPRAVPYWETLLLVGLILVTLTLGALTLGALVSTLEGEPGAAGWVSTSLVGVLTLGAFAGCVFLYRRR